MERVERKVRAKLRLQGMQFAGHEHLLILIALALFPSQAFQVFISMARHNNGHVDEDLVGESCPNRFEPCMHGRNQPGIFAGRHRRAESEPIGSPIAETQTVQLQE